MDDPFCHCFVWIKEKMHDCFPWTFFCPVRDPKGLWKDPKESQDSNSTFLVAKHLFGLQLFMSPDCFFFFFFFLAFVYLLVVC